MRMDGYIKTSDSTYFRLKTEFKDEDELKSYNEQINELEEQFIKNINQNILDLLSVKYTKSISQIAKWEIKPIILEIFSENNFWSREIKEALYNYFKEDARELAEQRAQLNIRMDIIEQRFLDLCRRFDEVIYSKK